MPAADRDRAGIDVLLWLLEGAFEGTEHSLLVNAASVRDEAWARVPEGAGRTVGAILGHVGGSKYIYENFAFGDASLEWGKGVMVPPVCRGPLIEWLREGQRRVAASLAALSDRQLEEKRLAPWRAGNRGARGSPRNHRARPVPRGRAEPPARPPRWQ